MQTVFITTSGLGTRLEGLTQYTNKALVPIGDRYAICRIVERFPAATTRFVVSIGYYGDHVRDFLELAYPEHTFVFVTVDPYAGPGSSQAYSMLACKAHLQEPFLYHCCDTILPASYVLPTFPTVTSSASGASVSLLVAPHSDYITYSGITVNGGKLVRFNRKREAIHDYVYIGISYIADPARFWSALEAAVAETPVESQGALGDTDAYRRLLGADLSLVDYVVTPTFYDTGNMDSYRAACAAFPSEVGAIVLAKPNESLCFLGDRVIKFLHSATANARRVKRGKALAAMGCGPAIVGERANFMAMRKEEGEVLATCREWGEVRRLLDWTAARLWSQWVFKRPEFVETCRQFYREKTMERLRMVQTADVSNINGCEIGSLGDLLAQVPWDTLYTKRFRRFHGDFILDNILRRRSAGSAGGDFVLLDWRDSFGSSETEWGDVAYDLAKLRHNLVFQHANIAQGHYSVVREGGSVYVDVKCNYLLVRQLEELDAWVAEHAEEYEWSVQKIRILQALIWLNMAPLYEAPLQDFLYYFGKWNLWLACGSTSGST